MSYLNILLAHWSNLLGLPYWAGNNFSWDPKLCDSSLVDPLMALGTMRKKDRVLLSWYISPYGLRFL